MFFAHGVQKVFGLWGGPGIGGFARILDGFGYTSAATLSWVVGIAELVFGAFLVLGVLTPFAAAGLVGIKINAVLLKTAGGFFIASPAGANAVELDVVLGLGAAALVFTGPGRIALDNGGPWHTRPAWGRAVHRRRGCRGSAGVLPAPQVVRPTRPRDPATAPVCAEVASAAYARSAFETGRSRSLGCHGRSAASILARRSASTSSSTSSSSARARTSMSTWSPSSTSPIAPPAAASGETCPTAMPLDPPENRPSVTSAQPSPKPGALEERRGVQHLLHPGPARRPLVAHDEHVSRLHLPAEDDRDRLLLALDDAGRSLEPPHVLGYPGGLDHRAVRGEVAAQHGEPAVGGVGVFDVADAAAGGVRVERRPAVLGRERLGGAHAAGRGVEQLDRVLGRGGGRARPTRSATPRARASGRCARPRAAALRATARRGSPGCRRRGGRPPCGSRSWATPSPGTAPSREMASIAARSKSTSPSWAAARMCRTVLVEPPMATSSAIAFSNALRVAIERGSTEASSSPYQRFASSITVRPASQEQLAAGRVGGQRRAVAGQREPERLGEAVHRVRGEHAGARAAGRARRTLDDREPIVIDRRRGGGGDRGDQVGRGVCDTVDDDRLAGLHRPAGDEHRRDVQPHRGVEHPGRDLVAVGDAHQRVGGVRR